MKVSMEWLSDYVEIGEPVEQVAAKLTMIGLETTRIDEIGRGWEHIVTGKVLDLRPHPRSDHLRVATFEAGADRLSVVCGAPNIAVGMVAPLALPGAVVGGQVIGGHEFAGEQSQGMALSPRELGISQDHSGLLALDASWETGRPLSSLLHDWVLEVDTKPNRADCLSVIGIAREVAAVTGRPLRLPNMSPSTTSDRPASESARIEVTAQDLCPRYTATVVRGVSVTPAPFWMTRRLLFSGVRAINVLVDITNYVMLEWGQPLHAFDLARIAHGKIVVRRARDGEEIETLDGATRALTSAMLLIADPRKPLAVAGVMGGARSEVADDTRDILIESANFAPTSVRRTSQALGLRSESSARFERGLDRHLTETGALRAARLMQELAGGQPEQGMVDWQAPIASPPFIWIAPSETERLLGVRYPQAAIRHSLEQVECRVIEPAVISDPPARPRWADDDALLVRPPSFRLDLEETADLIEEVGRLQGYDHIPTTLPSGPLPEPRADPMRALERTIRASLVGAGLMETITYSMTSEEAMGRALPSTDGHDGLLAIHHLVAFLAASESRADPRGPNAVRVLNPLSADRAILRLTLLHNALDTLRANQRHADTPLWFFELGKRYLPRANDLPEERRTLSIALMGPRAPRSWSDAPGTTDFHDLRGIVERLCSDCHARVEIGPGVHPAFQRGRTALLRAPAKSVTNAHAALAPDAIFGVFGQIHSHVAQRNDLNGRAYVAEIDLSALLMLSQATPVFTSVSRYQPVVHDLAVIVGRGAPAAALLRVVAEAGGHLVRAVSPVDLYEGEPLPTGHKSVAIAITYQAHDHTLEDSEVSAVEQRIKERLATEFSASFRE